MKTLWSIAVVLAGAMLVAGYAPEGTQEKVAAEKMIMGKVESTFKTPVVFRMGESLWTIRSETDSINNLGVEVEDLGGAVGIGSSDPVISNNGNFVAFVASGDLWMVDTRSGTKSRLTNIYPKAAGHPRSVDVYISGWSPDDKFLLINYFEPGYEDGHPAPPAGLKYGFHLLDMKTLELRYLPHLKYFSKWTSDSRSVIGARYNNQNDYDLVMYTIVEDKSEVIRHTSDGYGFTQLDLCGDRIVWIHNNQIVSGSLRGSDLEELSPKADFAEMQWPHFSPDCRKVVFNWKGGIGMTVNAESPPKLLASCESGCSFRWLDVDTLVASDEKGIRLISTKTGDTTTLIGQKTGDTTTLMGPMYLVGVGSN